MNSKKITLLCLGFYFAIRLFSYIFTPATPLLAQNLLNTLVSFFILALASFWIYKKDERGWYVVALEIILSGSGGYLKLGFFSLRTALLAASLILFFSRKIIAEKVSLFKRLELKHYLIFLLIGAAGFSALHGLYVGHDKSAVFSDFIPYLFLLYYFPLKELWSSDRFRELSKNAILVAIFGNALFILFTQIGLSSGLFALQDNYYHWYRDVALGKITDLNFHFYRLVLNEHLLIIPLTIYFIGNIVERQANKINILSLSSLLFVLANNLTRIYMVALAAGILMLFSLKNWKRWLAISTYTTIGFMLIFIATHTIASRGQSFGLEIFGLRLQSITSPQIEDSSLSRLLLLPKILEKIKTSPMLGTGLGDNITVYSPIFKNNITTPHFDWGYLEIIAEMGLVGLLAWILFIGYIFHKIIKNKNNNNILIAILISFLVINITSPALFHVFGIILLAILILWSI